MKKFLSIICLVFVLSILVMPSGRAFAEVGDPCKPRENGKSTFLGFPTWWKYLPEGRRNEKNQCIPQLTSQGECSEQTAEGECIGDGVDISSVWLIGLAIVEMLLQLVGILAVVMIIYGGFKFMTSQGNPEATKGARTTLTNALVGLLIALFAIAVVRFVVRFF